MRLYEIIPTTLGIQSLSRTLASQLGGLVVAQRFAKNQKVKLSEYTTTEYCKQLIQDIAKELAQANHIKLAVEKYAGVTLHKRRPGEKRPEPTLQHLDFGWLEVPPGYVAVLSPLPDACSETTEIQVRNKESRGDDYYSIKDVQCGLIVLLFDCSAFRTEPAGLPYLTIPAPTSPMGEGD